MLDLTKKAARLAVERARTSGGQVLDEGEQLLPGLIVVGCPGVGGPEPADAGRQIGEVPPDPVELEQRRPRRGAGRRLVGAVDGPVARVERPQVALRWRQQD